VRLADPDIVQPVFWVLRKKKNALFQSILAQSRQKSQGWGAGGSAPNEKGGLIQRAKPRACAGIA